jgi:hypothetical protein
MPFDPESAVNAGKKSKRDPAKKEESSIKEKMELLYEKVLDDLLMNQEKLTKTERVKVFVTLSNYIFPKTKSVRDKFTLDIAPCFSLDDERLKIIKELNYSYDSSEISARFHSLFGSIHIKQYEKVLDTVCIDKTFIGFELPT